MAGVPAGTTGAEDEARREGSPDARLRPLGPPFAQRVIPGAPVDGLGDGGEERPPDQAATRRELVLHGSSHLPKPRDSGLACPHSPGINCGDGQTLRGTGLPCPCHPG